MFDLSGRGPLTVAAKEKHSKMLELLLSLGESPNSTDADGFVPLLMALHWNNPAIARLLFNAGADPNYKSHFWAPPEILSFARLDSNRAAIALQKKKEKTTSLSRGTLDKHGSSFI